MKHIFRWLLFILVVSMVACGDKDSAITSLKMLKGAKTFAVPTGTVVNQFVLQKYPDAKIEYYNTVLDCAIAVKNGKADAAVYDKPVLLNIAGKNDGLTVLSDVLIDDQYGFAVQLENVTLKIAINDVLAELKTNGTYQEMTKRWFPAKGNPSPMPDIGLEDNNGVLRFGTAAVTEPMSFVDENHRIVGFDIEFASYIAKKLGKQLEIVDMEFGALLPALISGKVDMVGAGMSITEERAKKVLFSQCYYPSGIAAIVRSSLKPKTISKGLNMSTVADIKDKKIGVLMGSAHDVYAQKNFSDSEILQFQTISDLMVGLNSGKIDVTFFARPKLKDLFASNPNVGLLVDTLYVTDLGVAFNKEDVELLAEFNTFLREIKSNGIYDDMIERYVNQNLMTMPEIKGTTTNGILRTGVVADIGIPFIALVDGQLTGFDIELGKRFAARIGKEYVPMDMPFGSLLASISTRKIDMITSSMMITEERQKQVNFSDVYFYSAVCLVARKSDIAGIKKEMKLLSMVDLSDKKLGVLLGSIHDAYALKHFPSAEILQFQNTSDLLMALNLGKVDAGFYDKVALKDVFQKNRGLGILEENVFKVPIAAGFNEANDPLREKFNTFLKEIKANGIYDEMVKRWMIDKSGEMPDMPSTGANGKLRAGIVGDLGLPFTILQNDEYTGFDIELGKRFAAFAEMTWEPVDMPFGSLIAAISTQKTDIITASMMVNEEREKQIDFSEPYFESAVSVIAKKKNMGAQPKGRLTKLDDIADKKIGIFTGTVHDAFLQKKYPKADIYRYESTPDMILSLISGKIDAAMIGSNTAQIIIRKNPELGILTNKVYDMPLGIGFSKNNPAFRDEFNQFLKELREKKTYDTVFQRWFVDDPELAVMPEFQFNETGRKLAVGVATDDLPYVMYKDGKYVGFDIEIISRFAQKAGFVPEYVPMQFSSLIAAMAAGKVEMISDGIAITEERAKQINFSDPYCYFNTVVVTSKKNLDGGVESEPVAKKITFFQNVKESFFSNIIHEKRYLLIVEGLKVTIVISIFAALFGTIIGGLICFMRMSKNNFFSVTAKIYISLLRGTPVLVLLMIIYYVVFASVNIYPVLVAVIAFGLNFGAYVSEMFRTSIESIDRGQLEAGIAGGFTKVQTFIHIILPQALRHVLPVYKGEFISLVKMTSIVGYIAVQDLTKASDIIRSRTFDAFFPLIMVAIFYLIIAWILTWALSYVEISVDPKVKRSKRTKGANV